MWPTRRKNNLLKGIAMRNIKPWIIPIEIRITSSILISVVVITFVAVDYILQRNDPQKVFDFSAQAVLAGAAIYSAYIAGIALWANVEIEQQRNAFHILEELNRPDLVAAKNMLDLYLTDKVSKSDCYQIINSDASKKDSARRLLGAYEDMTIAIRTKFADEETIRRSSGKSIIAYYDRLSGYVEHLRKEGPQFQFYYSEVEQLVLEWKLHK